MALNINHAEAERLARELSAATGEPLTEAVVNALRERLERRQKRRPVPLNAKQVQREARQRLLRLPVRDARPADEILGYDERGLPG